MQTDTPALPSPFSRVLAAGGTRWAVVIRLLVGAVFLSEGIQKFLFPDALGVGRFIKIGIPAPEVMAPFVGVVETAGGLLILTGLATRPAALVLMINMLVAFSTTKVPILLSQGFWPMAHEARTDWSMFLGSFFLLLEGAGPWSLDARLGSGVRRIGRHVASLVLFLLVGFSLTGCQAPPPAAAPYQPQRRDITITTIPLLTKELQKVYPFLAEAFAPGGLLAGKEIYAFMPSTVTVIEGDTIEFHFINPEDDLHSFVLPPELSVALLGLRTTTATYVARHAGVFTFTCSIPAHLPAMWGQLVVLNPQAIGRAAAPDGADTARGS